MKILNTKMEVEMTKDTIISQRKTKKLAIFVALLTLFITNDFGASYLKKMFISFNLSI